MRRLVFVVFVAVFICCPRPVLAQTDKALGVSTSDTEILLPNQRRELLTNGAVVYIDERNTETRQLRIYAERIHLARSHSQTDELMIGFVSDSSITSPEAAIEKFNFRLSKAPNDVPSLLGRANSYLCMRQIPKAIDDFNTAIGLDGTNAALFVRRGEAFRRAGRLLDAVTDCSKALDLQPTLIPALLGRARAQGEIGKYDAAIDDCGKALALNDRSAGAFCCRGYVYVMLGDLTRATADFRSREPIWDEIQQRPFATDVPVVNPLLIDQPTGSLEMALKTWVKIHDVSPGLKESFVLRILCVARRDPFPYRDELLRGLMLRLPPQIEFRILVHLSHVLADRCEDYSGSVDQLTNAIQLFGEMPEPIRPAEPLTALLVLRARSLSELKQVDKAMVDCNRSIELDPKFAPAYFIRAACRRLDGDVAGSESDYKRAKELASEAKDKNFVIPEIRPGPGKP